MTLKQMEKVLMDNVPAKFGRDEIRAALRAGLAMADHLDRCINLHNPPIIRYEEALQLLVSWDKVTKGDK